MTAPSHRLITVPFSHYCEKARWALERAGVRYREDGHLPMLHYAATFAARGGRTVPVLVTPHGVLRDSTAILRYADARAAIDARLYPTDPALRREVDALEDLFDEKLGPASRRVVYSYVLRDRATALEFIRATPFVPRAELALFGSAYPLVRGVMARLLDLTPSRVARSLDRARALFDQVASRLADGQRYLAGERFSAADLTFASLAAPLVAPREYGVPLPDLDAMPPDAAATIAAMRATPAGDFVLRMYREHRRDVATHAH
jgi:glutathione S-transferase